MTGLPGARGSGRGRAAARSRQLSYTGVPGGRGLQPRAAEAGLLGPQHTRQVASVLAATLHQPELPSVGPCPRTLGLRCPSLTVLLADGVTPVKC